MSNSPFQPAAIRLRSLEIHELDKWFDFLSREIFPGDARSIIEGMWYDDAEKDIRGICIATDADGNIIGSAKAGCRPLLVQQQLVCTAILSGVGTKREYRGQGISRRLLEMCHDYARGKGAVLAHLYSKPDTFEFYRYLGYRNTPRRADESFYRMYRVLQPFPFQTHMIADTDEWIDRIR